MILIVYAHPHPGHSEANRVLLDAVRDMPGVTVRSLYDAYPDFSIDVAAEQALLRQARLVVWQHPIYWYSVPALQKLWFETVLESGWAYGEGGNALAGKDCLWVTTTGAKAEAYSPQGRHMHDFQTFAPPIAQTARFCAMNWLEPIVVHGAHKVDADTLDGFALQYRQRLRPYLEEQDGR